MTKQKKESFFWASYSDLMTSLFFVMLVLFVLVILLLHNKMIEIQDGRKATQEQLDKIREIEEAINKIDKKYFDYSTIYKKHVLKIKVNFPVQESNIDLISNSTYTKGELRNAGMSIQNLLKDINRQFPKIQYLLVIEGQSSKDSYAHNYELSYERALSLRRFWKNSDIDFGANCEVLISGSGTEGIMRDREEANNQRFLIHIIPKPGGIIENK